jgi:hypothetical protein
MASRWLLPFDAVDPKNTDSTWGIGIAEALYRKIQRSGHEAKLARIELIDDVVGRAGLVRLYGGWSRPTKDDCFVYVGRPDRDHRSLTIHVPPPPEMAFLVFVMEDGTIDEWTWRPAKPKTLEPDGVSGDLIWASSQT